MIALLRIGASTQVKFWRGAWTAAAVCTIGMVTSTVIAAAAPTALAGNRQLRLSTVLTPTAGSAVASVAPSGSLVAGDPDPMLPEKQFTSQQRADNAYRSAVTLAGAGHAAQAIVVLEPVLLANPANHAVRQMLAGLLIEEKRLDEAATCLQAGLEIEPLNLDMAMRLARLQLDQGNLREAIRTLQKVASVSDGEASYQGFLAALLQRDLRFHDAAEHYAQALRSVPQNGLWWMGYGMALQADKQHEAALEAFRQALDSPMLSVSLRAFVDQRMAQMTR